MNDPRPKIDPGLMARMIDAAPGRVRKRLDKEPAIAESWDWQQHGESWRVAAGGEQVTLEPVAGVLRLQDQLACSCLLAPKCFHVLACLHALPVSDEEPEAASSGESGYDAGGCGGDIDVAEDSSEEGSEQAAVGVVTPAMRGAAKRVGSAGEAVLRVGVRACGALTQAELLRAGHECRVAGLVTLANHVFRLVEGIRRLRGLSDEADSGAIERDLFAMLNTAAIVAGGETAPMWAVGAQRRKFMPLDVSRLFGWFAEPVWTRSGFAGVCTYLLNSKGTVYQIAEVREGGGELIASAYRGGIVLGELHAATRDVCRSELHVLDPTAAADGRLGRSRGTRWHMAGVSPFDGDAVQVPFGRAVADQLELVFESASQEVDQRRAGWDLIRFQGEVLGMERSDLVMRVDGERSPWQMRPAIDEPQVPYRENLTLLARAPGLRLRCVGRVDPTKARHVDLLAIGPGDESLREGHDARNSAAELPRLRLPDEWNGRCNLGLDRLRRHLITTCRRWPEEVAVAAGDGLGSDDGLDHLERHVRSIV